MRGGSFGWGFRNSLSEGGWKKGSRWWWWEGWDKRNEGGWIFGLERLALIGVVFLVCLSGVGCDPGGIHMSVSWMDG